MYRTCFFSIVLVGALVPIITQAEEPLTRREGFLMLWQSIQRPVMKIYEKPFADVSDGSDGYAEITYAKQRGLLDDRDLFRPDEPLLYEDALLWLYRLRNVDEIDAMQREHLAVLHERYPLLSPLSTFAEPVLESKLQNLIDQFDQKLATEEHLASYYAEDFHGLGTAFGETFDMNAFTAAHRTFPSNTLVKVTSVETGKTVLVRINDRGPYAPERSLDLSKASFAAIAPLSRGVITVTMERLGDAYMMPEADHSDGERNAEPAVEPTVDPHAQPCSRFAQRYQRRITRDVRFHRGVPHMLPFGFSLTLGSTKPFVVRSIERPDGVRERIEQWIYQDDERFSYVPPMVGEYRLRVDTAFGRTRDLRMKVNGCT